MSLVAGLTPKNFRYICILYRLPRWCSGKESTRQCGDTEDTVSIPGSGRSPGAGNGNPLQHSCLENSTDRGAWQATIHGVTKSWTRLSTHTHTHTLHVTHMCMCIIYESVYVLIYNKEIKIKMDSIVAIIAEKKKKTK